MKGKIVLVLTVPLLLASFLIASNGRREGLEFFIFFGQRVDSLDVVYPYEYHPDFIDGIPNTVASQDLSIQGRHTSGVNGGLSFLVADRVRLKLCLDYSRSLLEGQNSPYHIHLDYITLHPPDYKPVPVIRDESIIWAETQGMLKSLALLFNLEYEIWCSRRADLRLSGGVGYYRLFGNVYPLAYSEYWLGGHGVLFSQQYLLKLRLPASGKIGVNADLELAYHVSDRISIVAKAAYYRIGNASISPVIDEVLFLYYPDHVSEDKFKEIVDYLKLPPLEFNASYLTLKIGFRLSLW